MNDGMPLVSIMIPTYNRSEYLKQAIESSLMQTYDNIEVIVSDNASTDNTLNLAKQYLSNNKFKYYKNEKNIGICENWKKLLYEYASGKYAILLPDDDYICNKSHVKEAVDLMTKYKADFLLSNVDTLDEVTNDFIYRNSNSPELLTVEWSLENIGKFIPGTTFMLDLKKAKSLKAFIPDSYGIDFEIGIRFMLTGNTVVLHGRQRVFRAHQGADSRNCNIQVVWNGMTLPNRVMEFGLSKGLNKEKLKRMKDDLQHSYIQSQLFPNWIRLNGISPLSLLTFISKLRKRLKEVNCEEISLFKLMFTKLNLILIFMHLDKSKKIYRMIRKLYRIGARRDK